MSRKDKAPEYPYVLYASFHRKPDQYPRTLIVKFEHAEEAATWFQRMLGTERADRCYAVQYITQLGIKISSDKLQEIIETDGVSTLSDHQISMIARFKYGTWDEVHERHEPVDEDDGMPAAPRPERARRAHKPDGYVSITELCAASGVPAMIARAALRASGRAKPEYGWCFDPKEIPAIKKLCGIK